MNTSPTDMRQFPGVVQLGFAGSRCLLDPVPSDPQEAKALMDEIERQLTALLEALPAELGLPPGHFLCGISQVAIGADTLFTRACGKLKRPIPQRIFLPQHRQEYLAAKGSSGEPDFSAAEQAEAEALLAAKHVIQEQVVSDSPDRQRRFQDTNAEILSVSDVVVCLLGTDPAGKPGGTSDLLDRAAERGTPTLEVRVRVQDGKVVLEKKWHNRRAFRVPEVPRELSKLSLAAIGPKIA